MKKVVHRTFLTWDYEKEEKWINDMSAKGWQLYDVGFCRYAFNEGQPGEYIYRLELLGGWEPKDDCKRYIQFIEDTGVEHIGSTIHWNCFRKKAGAAGFELFSDINSRINHLNRISFYLVSFSIVCFLNVFNMTVLWYRDPMSESPLVAGIIFLAIGILVDCGAVILYSKKRELKKEKLLHE